MKGKKFFKPRKAAAMPFVAIILGLFALGFIALVIDLGNVYIQRKKMVTSADAAALAGAQVLKDNQEEIKKGTKTVSESESEAKTIAEQYAAANGADLDQIDVYVGSQSVTITNDKNETVTETRQVVNVVVGKNEPSIFARFLESDNTDVKAHAVGTWGYVKKSYIGNFLPLFTFDSDYAVNTDIYLHDKLKDSNCNYGYVDIGAGMGAIKLAIAGNSVGGSYIYENLLDGKPGNGQSLYDAVVERMKTAQGKSTEVERRNYMIGLVPVIDYDRFINDTTLNNVQSVKNGIITLSSQLKLPIKYFAYYEITDVIKQNDIYGSPEALEPDEYTRRGTALDYSSLLPTLLSENILNNQGTGVGDTTVIGRFTGKTVDAKTIAEAGDQIDPNPEGDTPAIYAKLLE